MHGLDGMLHVLDGMMHGLDGMMHGGKGAMHGLAKKLAVEFLSVGSVLMHADFVQSNGKRCTRVWSKGPFPDGF